MKNQKYFAEKRGHATVGGMRRFVYEFSSKEERDNFVKKNRGDSCAAVIKTEAKAKALKEYYDQIIASKYSEDAED